MVRIKRGKKNISVVFEIECESEPVLKGSWDGWNEHKMKKRKNGKYSLNKRLKPGSYEFGYLCNGVWVIEENLEKVFNPYGGENSVLNL